MASNLIIKTVICCFRWKKCGCIRCVCNDVASVLRLGYRRHLRPNDPREHPGCSIAGCTHWYRVSNGASDLLSRVYQLSGSFGKETSDDHIHRRCLQLQLPSGLLLLRARVHYEKYESTVVDLLNGVILRGQRLLRIDQLAFPRYQ